MKKPSFNVLLQILDEMEHKELCHLLKTQHAPQKKIKKSNRETHAKTSLTQNKI